MASVLRRGLALRLAPAMMAGTLIAGCQGLSSPFGGVSATAEAPNTSPSPSVAVADRPAPGPAEVGAVDPPAQSVATSPEAVPPAVVPVAMAPSAEDEIDVRRYLGPDYCPEIRIRESTEVLRQYESGHQDEPAHVIWQASVGKTARECLYDGQGGLTLKVGVSGRVASGPKGGPQTVTLPLRISLVKYKEAVVANELYPLPVTIPPQNATTFTEVRELNVPSPGQDRDLILYIGLDEKGEGLLDPNWRPPEPIEKPPVVAEEDLVIEEPEPEEERPAPRPKAKPQPQRPNVLPTPSEGFVLGG